MAYPHRLTHGGRPGQLPIVASNNWSATGKLLSGPESLAKALRVPPYGTIHLVSGSALKMFPVKDHVTGVQSGKPVTITHYVRGNN